MLQGRALDVYALLPFDKAKDYDELKSALLKRFELTEDGFRQKFRGCRPENGETFQQFAVRMGSYFDRWLEMSKVKPTYDGLYDLMLRDQFLSICNRDLLLFLKERIPETLADMSRLADQYREARRVSAVSLMNPHRKGSPTSAMPEKVRVKSRRRVKVSQNYLHLRNLVLRLAKKTLSATNVVN